MPVVPTTTVVGEGGMPITVVSLVGEGGQQMKAVVTKDGAPMMAQPGAPIQSMAFGRQPAGSMPFGSVPVGTGGRAFVAEPVAGRPPFVTEPVAVGTGVPQPFPSQQYYVPGQPVPSRQLATVTSVMPTQTVIAGRGPVRPGTAPVAMPYGGAGGVVAEPVAAYGAVQTVGTPVPTQPGAVRTAGYPVMTQPYVGQPVMTQQYVGAAAGAAIPMGPGALPMRGNLLKAGSITDDVFNMVDRNHDGVISRSEFRGALKGNIISATAGTRAALGR